jgi:hypothetical protein
MKCTFVFDYHCLKTKFESLNIIKKTIEALLDASNEVGLEVNTERTNYIFMSRYQTTGQNDRIKVANKFFENVTKFKYWE